MHLIQGESPNVAKYIANFNNTISLHLYGMAHLIETEVVVSTVAL